MLTLIFVFVMSAQFPADTTVVANVGRFSINADELVTSYEFGPGFVKRRPDPLRRHLNYMIAERLLALYAEDLRLDSTAFVRDRLDGLAEDAAVEELYREQILSRVRLSEDEIARDVRMANTNVSFRWIYSDSDDDAQSVQQALHAGASFDSIFAARIDSATGPGARSLETTVLRLERDQSAVAAVVIGLRVGETSTVVRGPDGLYIFHLDRIVRNPVVTETEAGQLRHEAITIRTAIKADSLADVYVKTMMLEFEPVIKAEGFNIVRALIADRGLSRDTKVAWEIPSNFWTEAGPQPITASGMMMDRPLVTFGNSVFTPRDFARWYDLRQFQFDTRSLSAFNNSVKRTIWKMVQDRLLSERAAAQGMFGRSNVKRQSEAWNAKILYLAGRSHILRSIRISDTDLQKRFKQSRNRIRDGSGNMPPFETVREQLWEEEFAEREVGTLRNALVGLRKRFTPWIDENKLHELSAGIPTEARPLEAVFYKPGGTFPRVAFPSIDEAWERMP